MESRSLPTPLVLYSQMMSVVQQRLDIIEAVRKSSERNFATAETAAFHGRKVVEGIAFACLIAADGNSGRLSKGLKSEWNAEKIFKRLKNGGFHVSISAQHPPRPPKVGEQLKMPVVAVVEGNRQVSTDKERLLQVYGRLHSWLHEANPFGLGSTAKFYDAHNARLWEDLSLLDELLKCHTALIDGWGFLCTLRGPTGQPVVMALEKIADP